MESRHDECQFSNPPSTMCGLQTPVGATNTLSARWTIPLMALPWSKRIARLMKTKGRKYTMKHLFKTGFAAAASLYAFFCYTKDELRFGWPRRGTLTFACTCVQLQATSCSIWFSFTWPWQSGFQPYACRFIVTTAKGSPDVTGRHVQWFRVQWFRVQCGQWWWCRRWA